MRILSLIGFFIISIMSAQTHRFFYEVKYKSDSSQIEPEKKIMVLDINPQNIKYYDYTFLEKDSMNIATNSQNTNWTDQIPIVRDKNSWINTNFVSVDFDYFKFPTEDKINWSLQNETKNLLGFQTQKATTNFGGRKWIAWFTREIPFSEGPYKFQGLPGLIISIQDSKQEYVFNLIKSQNLPITYDTSNILEIRYGFSPLLTTESKYIEKALQHYNDPFYSTKQGLMNGTITNVEYYGKKYRSATELISASKDAQNRILRNNNPIELNKAINYKAIK